MSTGNNFGLGEISHFGAFQRVGGKAGGFITKKFFHPSSMRNQEKLWKAQTQDERDQKKQLELEKRRDEERQVEEIRKQMYLAGQGKATDVSASKAVQDEARKSMSMSDRNEQREAISEQKRRREMLRREQRAREAEQEASGDEDVSSRGRAVSSSADAGPLARSRYEEDIYLLGHQSVWGSWYSVEKKRWGFACCRILSRSDDCTCEPVEEQPSKDEPRGKRRRRGGRGEAADQNGNAAEDAEEPHTAADEAIQNQEGGIVGGLERRSVALPSASSAAPTSFIDPKLLEAAERRQEKRRREERQKEEEKKSGYLAHLLADPTVA